MSNNLSTMFLGSMVASLMSLQAEAAYVDVFTSVKNPAVNIADVQKGQCPTGKVRQEEVRYQSDITGTMETQTVPVAITQGCFRVTVEYAIPETTRENALDRQEQVSSDTEYVLLPYSAAPALKAEQLKAWRPGLRAQLAKQYFKVSKLEWKTSTVNGFSRYGGEYDSQYNEKFEPATSQVTKLRIHVGGK